MARGVLILASLSVLALVAWLLWGGGGLEGHPGVVVPPTATENTSVAQPAVPAGPAGAVTAPSRELVVAPPAAPESPTGASVQVRVLGLDHQPVAGVVVYYGNPSAMSGALGELAAEEQLRIQSDSEVFLQRLGKTATTDAEGVARWHFVEKDRAWWLCVARRGEDYGETWVSMAAAPSVVTDLQLAADHSFVVQVVDAQQKPAANVPVQAGYLEQEVAGQTSRRPLGKTDAAGQCVVSHVQTWSSQIAPRGSLLPATIETDLPGILVAQDIDVKQPPAEPIVLVLPPAGGIEVTVRDAFGKPVRNAYFELREDVAEPDRAYTRRTDTNGVASYAFVGLGRRWRLARDHEMPSRAKVVEGPRAAGEVVKVLLQPDPVPVLTGQLVRDGKSMVDVGFSVDGFAAGPSRTDAEGRFRIAASAGEREKLLTELVVYTTTKEGFDGMSATWRGQVVLSLGEHDLGVLTLQPDPIVCAGQVVGPNGEVAPAEVGVVVEATTTDATNGPKAVRLRQRRESDGHFTVYGMAPEGALQLAVGTYNKFLPVPPIPFVAGARNLRVELHRGGSLRVTILANSHLEIFCLQPRLIPAAALDLPEYARFNPQLDPRMPLEWDLVGDKPLEAAYRWPAVAPGRYRVEIGTRGVRRPIQVIQDVIIVDGERNEDARLQKIAVPGLRAIEITLPQVGQVVLGPGQRGLGVIYVLDGEELGEQAWQIDNVRAQFASTQPLDLLVRMPGFRDRIVRGIVSNQAIELEPGLPATVRCEAFAPPEGSVVSVSLECLDDRLSAAHSPVYSAAAGATMFAYRLAPIVGELVHGEALLKLPLPGRYRVSASLRKADGGTSELVAEPSELQTGAAGGTFPIELRAR
jgi:hypothetical protein